MKNSEKMYFIKCNKLKTKKIMETYTIEKLNIGDKKSGETKGKKWSYFPVGIQINGTWHNQIIFDEKLLENFKVGNKMELILFEEEYKEKVYKKFKLPSETDKLISRIERLESGLAKLYNNDNIKKLLK